MLGLLGSTTPSRSASFMATGLEGAFSQKEHINQGLFVMNSTEEDESNSTPEKPWQEVAMQYASVMAMCGHWSW
jgi:hypothetical protein